jgi:hypothetical protein
LVKASVPSALKYIACVVEAFEPLFAVVTAGLVWITFFSIRVQNVRDQ